MSTENAEQQEFWEAFAEVWVTQQQALDGLMAPVLDLVLDRAGLKEGDRVLDIGCGTGTSTLRAAQRTAPGGHVMGVDISDPMLRRARSIAGSVSGVRFETADATHYNFEAASFDAVISRFGVMFFVDPVLAFSNIRRAMKPGARMTMACWGELKSNPWFQVPMYAAKDHLGAPPPVDPDAPGPMAFRDIKRVSGIMRDAGFGDVSGSANDLYLTPPGDLAAVARHASSIGPASRAVSHFNGGPEDIAVITKSIEDALSQYATADGILVPAKINLFTATA
ncbi:MAG: class I SAM-dependent methyltransferase [Pseudomonadota bacterium]